MLQDEFAIGALMEGQASNRAGSVASAGKSKMAAREYAGKHVAASALRYNVICPLPREYRDRGVVGYFRGVISHASDQTDKSRYDGGLQRRLQLSDEIKKP